MPTRLVLLSCFSYLTGFSISFFVCYSPVLSNLSVTFVLFDFTHLAVFDPIAIAV